MNAQTRMDPMTTELQPQTMMAIVQTEYGDADVLRLGTIACPTVGAGEVRIRVHAAGLDRGTWHLMTGKPYLVRLAMGLWRPRNPVPGFDVAGVVEAVAADVTQFEVGDAVFGVSKGSFAEVAIARADKLAHKPTSLSFQAAAVLGISGMTALQGLRDQAKVQPGQRVLIVGASGAVGTYAVQIARVFGAVVTGVCSGAKAELVRSLGASDVIDYTRQDFADGSKTYDVIFDLAGNRPLATLRKALAPRGTIVFVGGEEGGSLTGGMSRQLGAAIRSLFSAQRFVLKLPNERGADLGVLAKMADAGQITPVIDGVWPLAQAADAMRRLVSGKAAGKVGIVVCEDV